MVNMTTSRNILPALVLILLATLASSAYAENKAFDAAALADDIHAEFADFPSVHYDSESDAVGRRLQSNNNNNNGGSSSTETTTCNLWCQIKNSLGLTIVGLVLLCISPILVWKNEGRHVTALRKIDYFKNKATVIGNVDAPSEDFTNQLVHFTGQVSVDDTSLDLPAAPLNLTSPVPNALLVRRTCLIYQKFENVQQDTQSATVGGGQTTTTTYTVREDWTPLGPQPEQLPHLPQETNSSGIWSDLVAASGASESARPAGPEGFPPELAALFQTVDFNSAPHGIAVAPSAHVGEFALSKEIIVEEPAVFQAEWVPVPSDMIPDEVEGCPDLRKDGHGNLTTVAEGEGPRNGDVMIKYEYAPAGFDASFIVEQVLAESDPETGVGAHKFGVAKNRVIDERCCGKISDDLGVVWMVRRGRHDLGEMIQMAKEDETTVTKILRLVCWVLLVAAWWMLFSVITTLLSTLPIVKQLGNFAFFLVALILGTSCCCMVTAVAYIRYRPLLAFIIIAIGATIGGVIGWKAGSTAEENAENPPAMAFVEAVIQHLAPIDFGKDELDGSSAVEVY
eukprot:CAMPEP_0171328538 /NCGR_PEP_ID=MMETSP0878-20121228/713_1 /TAXON_ID=67004 /ORGANISM="Thalassiosira weissflogii, Strain CCMP1336" /LENGTH=565 /DNA_ID=CAMNT_0011828395 /DNA_START=49 /DNA_END=1749 /DNA_ORIENTATION=+